MKTKERDEFYCGVREEVIKNSNPVVTRSSLSLFLRYIKIRYRIHFKKDVLKYSPPWTTDEILSKYKFTNIRREHDRETLWLINNIAENEFLTYRQKLLNIILFRAYNKHETLEIIDAPFNFDKYWNFKEPMKKLKEYAKEYPDYVFFTNAFITGGIKLGLKKVFTKEDFPPGLILRFMRKLNESSLIEDIKACKNQKEVFDLLKDLPGIGDFLAYQIFVDFTYIKEFPFSENEFTVAGPGCKRGINFLFKDKDGMTYEECLFWLRDNWEDLQYLVKPKYRFFPEKEMLDLKYYDRIMNVMSLENCFCEFSKYYKAFWNQGRPRNTYKPKIKED